MDLLAGIHYNLHREPPLDTLTAESVCGANSTLEEPQGGEGKFLEAVQKLCLFVSSNPNIFKEIQYTQVWNATTHVHTQLDKHTNATQLKKNTNTQTYSLTFSYLHPTLSPEHLSCSAVYQGSVQQESRPGGECAAAGGGGEGGRDAGCPWLALLLCHGELETSLGDNLPRCC